MFKLLRLARLLSKYLPTAPLTVDWTEGDQKNLSAFFGTRTGQKLEMISHMHISQSAMTACSPQGTDEPTKDYEYQCGISQGVRLTWATIATLKFRTPQSQEGTTERDDSRIPEAFQ